MSGTIWLEPVGAAKAAYEAYRAKWIEARGAAIDFAASRGADGYLPYSDGRFCGLFFKKEPKEVPAAYRLSPGHRSGHVYTLRSARALATREAVTAEEAALKELISFPDLEELAKSLGLPTAYEYKAPEGAEASSGMGRIGMFTAWDPVWTHQEGTIFLKGRDFRDIPARYPDHVVSFNAGDGTIPEDMFRILHEHQVVYIQGEEKLAFERRKAHVSTETDVAL